VAAPRKQEKVDCKPKFPIEEIECKIDSKTPKISLFVSKTHGIE
jgi:hypothetical protein